MSLSNVDTCSHFLMHGPLYIHMEAQPPKLDDPCAVIDEVGSNPNEYAMFLHSNVLENGAS